MNKEALEAINEVGFSVESFKDLMEQLDGGVTLYGDDINLIIEIDEDSKITRIEKEFTTRDCIFSE